MLLFQNNDSIFTIHNCLSDIAKVLRQIFGIIFQFHHAVDGIQSKFSYDCVFACLKPMELKNIFCLSYYFN